MASMDMTNTGSSVSFLLQGAGQAAFQAISYVQVELTVFFIAVCVHLVFFGKYRIPKRSKCDVPKADAVEEMAADGSRRQRLAAKQAVTRRLQDAAVLDSFREGRRVEDAVKAFRGFSEKPPGLYNKFLDVLVDCKAFDLAEEVMAEARGLGMADVVTFNTMIKAHIQRNQLPQAHVMVEEMRKAGLKPTSVTFNELLDATVRTNTDSAWDLLTEMGAYGVKPNPVTTSILLKGIQATSKPAEVERAMAVLSAIDDQMDEVLLSSVIEACIRAGRADLLQKLLDRQRTNNRVQVTGAHTYGSLIRAYGAVRDLSGAWDAWQQMKAKNVLPTSITFGCMVEALVSNGSPEVAHGLIREALTNPETRPLVNSVQYCSVLKGLSHQKRFERLWELYQEIMQEKLPLSLPIFNTLVDACARCGEMARAPRLLDNMIHHGIEPNLITYSSILKGYCQENKLDKALELMEQMKQASQFKPDEVTYNTLLDGCARQGLYDRGMLLLEEMEAAGVRPSNYTLSVLVKLANRGKRIEKCFELTAELSKKYNFSPNVHVYNNLVQACVNNKDVQRGLDLLVEMLSKKPSVVPDARTYTLLLRGCLNAGLARTCADLLRLALGAPLADPEASLAAKVPGGVMALKLPKGVMLGEDVVAEIVEGLARQSRQEQVAQDLFRDLQTVKGLHLDPKLSKRLTTRMPLKGACSNDGAARKAGRGGCRA